MWTVPKDLFFFTSSASLMEQKSIMFSRPMEVKNITSDLWGEKSAYAVVKNVLSLALCCCTSKDWRKHDIHFDFKGKSFSQMELPPRPQLFDFNGVSMTNIFTDNWDNVQNFKARPDDILIATYPKAGTDLYIKVWSLCNHSIFLCVCSSTILH